MLNTIFENEAFIISSIQKEVVTHLQVVGYLIFPKFLNVPVINFKYLYNLNNIFQNIGAYPYTSELSELTQETTTQHKIQYFIPTIHWKNLKKALEQSNHNLQLLSDNLFDAEKTQQEELFNLLNTVNSATKNLYLWHGMQI